MNKRQENKLDKEISTLYSRLSAGRTINVMKIGSVFKDVKRDHLAGLDLEASIKLAIEKYCEPKGSI